MRVFGGLRFPRFRYTASRLRAGTSSLDAACGIEIRGFRLPRLPCIYRGYVLSTSMELGNIGKLTASISSIPLHTLHRGYGLIKVFNL